MLIVIEGLDGSGKSTQVNMLREHLENEYGVCHYIHFPRYNSPVYGEIISRFLRGEFGAIDQVHPQLVALIYAEDRHRAVPDLLEYINTGMPVLLDRYVYSNIAYQCAKIHDMTNKEYIRKWITDTEYGDFKLPVPDVNLFLDVPISFVENNLHSQRIGDNDRQYLDGKKDIHETDISFQDDVRCEYLRQCELDSSFVRIDCADESGYIAPTNTVFNRILLKLNQLGIK